MEQTSATMVKWQSKGGYERKKKSFFKRWKSNPNEKNQKKSWLVECKIVVRQGKREFDMKLVRNIKHNT